MCFLLQRCKLHHVWKHVYKKNVRVDCNAYGDVDVFRIGRHRCTRIHQIMLPRLIVCSVGFSLLLDLSPAHFHPGPKATAGSPVAWATRCPPSGWAFRVSLVRLHRVQVGDIGPLPSRSTVVDSLMRSLRVFFAPTLQTSSCLEACLPKKCASGLQCLW